MKRVVAPCVLLAVLAPTGARAQDGLAGSVAGHLLASPQADIGGGIGADLHAALGPVRLGGFLGVGAVPSDDDVHNRVFMALGPSLGVELVGDVAGFAARLRLGLWGGATQEEKIVAGGFLGGGAYVLFRLGAGATLAVGVDVWGIFGSGETALFAPGVGLTWTPATPR